MDTVLIISSWPTGLYDYVQYMQMQSICIVIAYADVRHMDMFNLCCILSFFRSDPKKASSGSSSPTPTRCGAETQHVPFHQLLFILYIVFIPCPATARSAP
ncbi:hypothetical protein CSC18_4779 [Klebsiella aerogenes]|nr:hypothetical protein CSC18_4779 [Klebsiella aerogenes]